MIALSYFGTETKEVRTDVIEGSCYESTESYEHSSWYLFIILSLQPHNILLANKQNSAPVKLADFGVARILDSNGLITSGWYFSLIRSITTRTVLQSLKCICIGSVETACSLISQIYTVFLEFGGTKQWCNCAILTFSRSLPLLFFWAYEY